MTKTKVYDFPTRLLHWTFAGLFIGAFAFAKLNDDESPWFTQHMLLGLILGCVVVLRLVWGVFGSRHARIVSFPLKPTQLAEYLREVLTWKGRRYLGHNPASAWGAIVMIILAAGLAATGYLMATGHKETFEDIHELMANGFALAVIAHIAGLALHQLQHRDGIALSMVHGGKETDAGEVGIPHSYPLVAIGMVGVIGLFAFHVYKNYDAARSTARVFGAELQLGEDESPEHGGAADQGDDNDD